MYVGVGSVLFRIVQKVEKYGEREGDRRRRSNAKRYRGPLLKFASSSLALNDADRFSRREWSDFLHIRRFLVSFVACILSL